MSKEKKSVLNIIIGILSVFATIIIPILSWGPIKSAFDRLFSNSSFWNSVWVFFTKPRFSFVTILWVFLLGFVVYKFLFYVMKNSNLKERSFIKKAPNQMGINDNLKVKYKIVFEDGQPTPTDVVLYCSVGDSYQQLNHHSHNSCIVGFGCTEDCMLKQMKGYHEAVDVIINCVKSDLMKDWNEFI